MRIPGVIHEILPMSTEVRFLFPYNISIGQLRSIAVERAKDILDSGKQHFHSFTLYVCRLQLCFESRRSFR